MAEEEPVPPLPLPPADVVCQEYFIFPPLEDFKEEFARRIPELNTPEIMEWIDENARTTMPEPQAGVPGAGRCAVCTSNWLGMPMEAHNVHQCPIPVQFRPAFQAINTRSMCTQCRGRSDNHDRCNAPLEHCAQCLENGKGLRRHHPMSSICVIPTDCEEEYFNMERKKQYRRNYLKSLQEPFKLMLYNDEPLFHTPANYDQLIGIKALRATTNIFGQVEYAPLPSYPGFVPAHQTDARAMVDQMIARLQETYYATESPGRDPPSPEVQEQIQAHNDAKRRNEERRREWLRQRREPWARPEAINIVQEPMPEEQHQEEEDPEMERAENAEVSESESPSSDAESPSSDAPDNENAPDNASPVKSDSASESSEEPEPKRAESVKASPPKPPARASKTSSSSSTGNTETQVMGSMESTEEEMERFVTDTVMTTKGVPTVPVIAPKPKLTSSQQRQNYGTPAVVEDEGAKKWWDERKLKVEMMIRVSSGIQKRMMRKAGSKFEIVRSIKVTEPEHDRRPYRILIHQLKKTVTEIAMKSIIDYDDAIPKLQQAITGRHESPEFFKDSEKWSEGGKNWKELYYELLLKIACSIVVINKPTYTELSKDSDSKIDVLLVPETVHIPSSQFYLDSYYLHREYAFMVYATAIAQTLPGW